MLTTSDSLISDSKCNILSTARTAPVRHRGLLIYNLWGNIFEAMDKFVGNDVTEKNASVSYHAHCNFESRLHKNRSQFCRMISNVLYRNETRNFLFMYTNVFRLRIRELNLKA